MSVAVQYELLHTILYNHFLSVSVSILESAVWTNHNLEEEENIVHTQYKKICFRIYFSFLSPGLLDDYLSQAAEEEVPASQLADPEEEEEPEQDLEKAQLHSCLMNIVDTLRQNNPRYSISKFASIMWRCLQSYHDSFIYHRYDKSRFQNNCWENG